MANEFLDKSGLTYLWGKLKAKFAPKTHAGQHASSGADPITPAAIGAVAVSAVGAVSGVASLDVNGKLTAEQASSAIVEVTGNRTLQLSDAGKLLLVNSSSAVTLTIPFHTSVAFPVGTELEVMRRGSGAVTFAEATSVGLLHPTSSKTMGNQYSVAALKLISAGDSGDRWVISGGMA